MPTPKWTSVFKVNNLITLSESVACILAMDGKLPPDMSDQLSKASEGAREGLKELARAIPCNHHREPAEKIEHLPDLCHLEPLECELEELA